MERRSPDPEPPPESKLPKDPIPVLPEEDSGCCAGSLVIVSEGSPESGQLPRVRLRNREFEVCSRSLYVFPLRSCVRRRVIELVTWWAFDKFILFLIFFNSICLASYDHRSESDSGFNWVSDNIFDPILTSFFTLEFILKVIAFGFVVDKTSYLRDAWNWLDFIVVVTGVLQMTNAITSQEGVGFLRMFRILRPLRSLNAVPQMKVLVNTVLSSIPRLGNVSIMAAFLFVSFGIVGVSLFGGVFHRGCHTIPKPILIGANGTECWSWPFTGEERLCGGRYLCEDGPGGSTGFCGGHEQDTDKALRPVFDGGRQRFPWCEGSAPFKVFPESEWICFDHMGSALITIFQCMTLEGWTDVMYRLQDGHGMVVATVYFFLLIPITSFFLLNVALAVVDEAREDFAEEAADEAAQEEAEERELRAKLEEEAVESKGTATHAGHDGAGHPDHLHPDDRPNPKPASLMGQLVDAAEDVTRAMSKALDEEVEDDEAPWWDVAPVRLLLAIATNEVFTNIIMCFIAGNVITMMLDGYPPIVSLQDFLATCENVFLIIFCVEMCIMIGAYGPCRYLKTPVTCFDGIIVTASVVQVLSTPDGQAPFTALRTLRLFRVLNKLASRWPSFRVLLKAMLYTGKSLSYWIVLFSLVLYICTLMFTQLFQSTFHFVDVDTLAEVSPDQGGAWCGGTEGLDEAFRQDCIPRAHFDTFLWSLVSIFQIMTGENWNTIMYAGMRAQNWAYAAVFVLLIIFGQILFLSLFLSMLLSKFDEVQDEMERREAEKMSKSKEEMTRSWRSILRAVSRVRTAGEFLQKVMPDPDQQEAATEWPQQAVLALQVLSQEENALGLSALKGIAQEVEREASVDLREDCGSIVDEISVEGQVGNGVRMSSSGTMYSTKKSTAVTTSSGNDEALENACRKSSGKNISHRRRLRTAKLLVRVLNRRRRPKRPSCRRASGKVQNRFNCNMDDVETSSNRSSCQKVSFECGGSDVCSQSSRLSPVNSVVVACRQLLGPLHDRLPPAQYISKRVEDHLTCSAEMVKLKAFSEISRHCYNQRLSDWTDRAESYRTSVLLNKGRSPDEQLLPEQIWRSEVLGHLQAPHPGPRPLDPHLPQEEDLWHKAWKRTYESDSESEDAEGVAASMQL